MHPAPHPADWARLERALKRQEIAEEAAHVGTFEADLATGELTISREVARLHHWDPALLTLSGQEFLRSVHPVDRDRIMGLAGSREDFTVDYRFLCPDGISTRIFEISGRWLAVDAETDHPRHPGYFVGVERDVTEQRAQEAQLRRLALHDSLTGALNRRGFEDLLTRYAAEHAVPDSGSLLMIDLDHFKHHNDTYGHAVGDALLVAIASAVQEHLGPEEAIGRIGGDEFAVLLPGRDPHAARSVADQLLSAIAGAAEGVSPDPEHPVTASIGVAAFTDDADPTLVLRRADEAMYAAKSAGGARSAGWGKHQQHPEEAGSGTSELGTTIGLPDRAALLTRMEQRLAGADASRELVTMTAYVVDVFGLELLGRERAAHAREQVLRGLVAQIAALGGAGTPIGLLDECRVAALLPVATPADLDELTRAVHAAVEGADDADDVALSAMIGVATWEPGTDPFVLLQNAIIALTAARVNGPGSVRSYDPELRSWASSRTSRHVTLRRALERREFRLHFQPAVELATGTFSRAEALVRWQQPTGGIVGPDVFIPFAEATGLILPLGEQVVDLAVQQARAWRAPLPDLRISLNISAIELSTPGFAEGLIERVAAGGADGSHFALEVTESAVIANPVVARAALLRLREAGFRVVIDDFGAGHSTLARLTDIPVQGIKIDMGLVQRLRTDPASRTVLRAIVDVGRAYDFTVTAEGVEDAETFDIVRDHGVGWVQGFYVSHPRPAEELDDVLAGSWDRYL
ncbi:EAL domain-containing protein [Nocardioides nematodiphilus]|uniref:EAL domain-containing protein n=1 Tax=Nocardioides nematodiphilus TaxID=2849669 RepID=UPI001CD931E8|nr:EAL domain-containing protein [Nocardioides nematodiphilus]MCA1982049.1 EAL domain-containing protein [Nocardioides nematodiphilus]